MNHTGQKDQQSEDLNISSLHVCKVFKYMQFIVSTLQFCILLRIPNNFILFHLKPLHSQFLISHAILWLLIFIWQIWFSGFNIFLWVFETKYFYLLLRRQTSENKPKRLKLRKRKEHEKIYNFLALSFVKYVNFNWLGCICWSSWPRNKWISWPMIIG